MPKVSVIVPNYNHQSFLKQRIDSILNQTYQDFELILLDDASTDESLELLKSYKSHPKVCQLIINDKNSGSPFIQWCRGIELALGDYVWIAESDDFAEPDFLEKTVLNLNNNQYSNLVYVDSRIVNDKGQYIDLWSVRKNKNFNTKKWGSDYKNEGEREVIDFLLYSTIINNASAVLFRKKSLNEATFLKYLSSLKTAGDLFTYIFVSLQGEISYISEPLNNYREHAKNVTKKNSSNGLLYLERIYCFEKALIFINERELIKNEVANLKRGYSYILKKNGFKLMDFGLGKELNHFIKKIVQSSIFTRNEGFLYRYLYILYALKSTILKRALKRIIKRVL